MTNQQNTSDLSLDGVFHALSDSTRRAVLARLTTGPASVSELAQPFEMALPSFMQHLKVLEGSGLVSTQKQGRVRTCEMEPQALSTAQDWIVEQKALWEGRLDRLESYLDGLQASANKEE
ncbi:metalloregulator ArsR/SmtB family transcription factor [Pyruvatibacter sp. HU-CL02332]|uniref:ArsR/SmtB family transcription factor n=1 Tax=Pyruvatibacter sp. HU-CL02332 TaxID=3127650 RepID=UPI003109DDDB